jgi:Glycosyl transferases group 1
MHAPLPLQPRFAPKGHGVAGRALQGPVVHLALQLDESMLRLLGPATAVLARSGQPQTLVLIDHPKSRPMLDRLDLDVQVVSVPYQRNPFVQWRALGEAFAAVIQAAPAAAVHMYGHAAGVLGERVLHRLDCSVPRFRSPDGGGPALAWHPLSLLARLLDREHRGTVPARGIGNGVSASEALHGLSAQPVTMVEGPVGAAYFAATPHAARHPLIVGASRVADPLATAAFDQLAVLLGGDGLGLAFNWLGPLDPVSAARLKAAHVGVFDPHDDAERATRMAAGWIFVAMGAGRRFPISLAEAMASGLPCVAMDNPGHRSLVRQGETGYLCRSSGEAVDRIAQLADTPSLRERMGHAGRALALERFGELRFRDTLIAAYAALPTPAAARTEAPARALAPTPSTAMDRP